MVTGGGYAPDLDGILTSVHLDARLWLSCPNAPGTRVVYPTAQVVQQPVNSSMVAFLSLQHTPARVTDEDQAPTCLLIPPYPQHRTLEHTAQRATTRNPTRPTASISLPHEAVPLPAPSPRPQRHGPGPGGQGLRHQRNGGGGGAPGGQPQGRGGGMFTWAESSKENL